MKVKKDAEYTIGLVRAIGRIPKVLKDMILVCLAELQEYQQGIPMILSCPCCHARHYDEGRFATHPHHTHACQKCGVVWRPAKVNTFGVRFLPGYKNETRTRFEKIDS